MPINARRALIANAREAFAQHLMDVVGWDRVVLHQAEEAPIPEGRSRNLLGKWRERVVLGFDDFQVVVASSEDHPPLGLVELNHAGTCLVSGPIDAATWAAAAKEVKALKQDRVA
jgi:hypothetical protein